MDGNDGRRGALIHEYYRIYRQLQERHGLREHSRFDLHGNNLIEIWEYAGGRKKGCVCKVREADEAACYKRAIEMLKSYGRKGDLIENERAEGQRAG